MPATTDNSTIPPGGPNDPGGHYTALGASPTDSTEDLVRAHRRAARRWHPDRNPGRDTTREMQRVNAAAEVLLDPDRRAEYDRSARRSPIVLTVVPGTANLHPTTIGRPVTTRVTVRANEPVSEDERNDLRISALSGPGWTASLISSANPHVVVIIEITCPARVVGRVADTIIVRLAGRSVVIQVNGTVARSPVGHASPPPRPPPPPPPPQRMPVRHTGARWWGSTGPAWSGWTTSLVWPAAIVSVVLVGNSTAGYVEDATILAGIVNAMPWFAGFLMAAGLAALAWATRLFTRGGWALRILTGVFIAPAVIVAGIAAVIMLLVVLGFVVLFFVIALAS